MTLGLPFHIKNTTNLLTALLLAALAVLHAAELYVADNGDDKATGSLATPFLTIQHAYDHAGPGDIIILRKGTYREEVSLTNKSGKEGAPITLKAYKDENPIISGLDVLKLDWQATPQAGIYVASFDTQAVRQLFYNGKPMLEARWPHCPKDKNGEWDFFSPDMWATADAKGNSYGTLVCADLAKTGWNVTGAQALLNVGHQFFCWTRPVRTHAAGSNTITYDQDLGKSVDRKVDEGGGREKWDERNKFYLFGMRQFLGAPGEWFYDAAARKLYVCSPDARSPANSLLEIKTRERGFTADNTCNYLTIDGIVFFGTAFKFGESVNKRRSHIVLRNNSVLYSSWTEYVGLPKGDTKTKADQIYPTIHADNSQVVNNTFAYGALSGLSINGLDNVIENNVFHDFDYSSSLVYPPLQVGNSQEDFVGQSGRAVIRYNTFYRSGGIQARIAQADNDFSMNDVYDSFLACYGGNKDTSAVYTQKPFCAGTRFHHNWVHGGFAGTPPLPWGGGIGIRGDDLTCGLTVDHNVIWDMGGPGIMIKNVVNPTPDQANSCVNNTVFNHSAYTLTKNAIIIATFLGGKSKEMEKLNPIASSQPRENPNALSLVQNNLADSISGKWSGKPLSMVKFFSNNYANFKAATDLVNTNWCDFRPVAGASSIINQGIAVGKIAPTLAGKTPDIGAYQRGDSIYWIPGQRLAKASNPIVPDQATNVPADRDVLMWKPAYGATTHKVTFATSREGLDQTKEQTAQKIFNGEDNVFILPHLTAGTMYFWRVDAVLADTSVVKGDVWTFATQ